MKRIRQLEDNLMFIENELRKTKETVNLKSEETNNLNALRASDFHDI